MDDYLVGVLSNIGVISFVALSAYLLLLTGEISFGQQAFFDRRLRRRHCDRDVGWTLI
jgi:ABC-type branched-subunit amino acid transport system permease subunit